ncbi:hypothetical protein ACQWIG_24450, partial [Salmonella enterica subsp. enterica serovar Infantis]
TFGTLMSMEPALDAVSGMIFLGETLTGIQILALCAIIAASMGSNLTIRREPQIKQVDVKYFLILHDVHNHAEYHLV